MKIHFRTRIYKYSYTKEAISKFEMASLCYF